MRAETDQIISLPGAVQAAPVGVALVAPHRFDMAQQPALTRAQQIAATLDGAVVHEGFRASVALADAARDRGDWAMAELEYGQALRRFPLHWGYCIQFAHTVKEQEMFDQAEIWYRSAVALGAPADMVDQHLAFVARLNGADFEREGLPRLDVAPMLAPPTIHDIGVLGKLLRLPGLTGCEVVLQLLRTAPNNRAVLLRMLDMPGVLHANRAFFALLEA